MGETSKWEKHQKSNTTSLPVCLKKFFSAVLNMLLRFLKIDLAFLKIEKNNEEIIIFTAFSYLLPNIKDHKNFLFPKNYEELEFKLGRCTKIKCKELSRKR